MTLAVVGAALVAVAFALVVIATLEPLRVRLPRARRRPAAVEGDGALSGAADVATSLMSRLIRTRAGALARALDLAGLRARPQDFALLVVVAALVLVAIGVLLGSGILALPLAGIALAGAWGFLRVRIARRRRAFAEQLGPTLQLMTSSLRAGQSALQALSSVANEAEEPTAAELTRIVNETRVGRPLVDALEEAADRMESVDFRWATQAIAINREVGGSLSDVLDGVAATIRERSVLRGQVAALSAEGRLSAIILILLPIGVVGFLVVTNPGYLAPFLQHPLGLAAIVAAIVLMLVGSIWLKKTVEVEF